MFSTAIVIPPCRRIADGLTTANLGKPDYRRALAQHAAYVQALAQCGLSVIQLPGDDNYPDSTFVEDTALVTPACAIITRPGAPSRRGETAAVKTALGKFYPHVEEVTAPGCVDAGDIMMAGTHFYIGLSERTNREGAGQVAAILQKYGLTASFVPLKQVLHLKSGLAYLEDNHLVAAGEFLQQPEFAAFDILAVDDDERDAANCLWVNGRVLVPAGCPRSKKRIQDAGYETIEVDVSEFQKLDGGLSCLSLRF